MSILGILIAVTQLNSCTSFNKNNEEEVEITKGYEKKKEVLQPSFEKNKQDQQDEATCPWCEGSYRYFYKLSNGYIILICEECNCMWVDPTKMDLSNAIGESKLKEKFTTNGPEELFDGKSSGWATKEEAEKSEWKDVVHKNDLLVNPALVME